MKNVYLCSEHGERFYITAPNLKLAKLDAATWGAEVIAGPLPEKYLAINPATLNVVDGKLFTAVGKIN